MSTKNIDDLTIDEIKEQMALFTRLYYKKKKVEDPEFLERRRALDRQRYHRKKEEEGTVHQPPKNDYNRKCKGNNLILVSTPEK